MRESASATRVAEAPPSIDRSTREWPEWAGAIAAALAHPPRRLPPWLLYDALGSVLFEAIALLPEYYLTRCETGILLRRADEIARRMRPGLHVIELGAGSATKTRIVLDAVARRDLPRYVPIDVSETALAAASRALGSGFDVRPVVGRYEVVLPRLSATASPKLVVFIGSSIGNYEPGDAKTLLRLIRSALAPGDHLLLGADLPKPESVLLRAYDDAVGVTAAFDRNVLVRLQREIGATFVPSAFRHLALWNAEEWRVEMHLESTRDQLVRIAAADVTIRLRRGDRIHTESSHKWPLEMQQAMLRDAGFEVESTWQDARGWFALHLARAA